MQPSDQIYFEQAEEIGRLRRWINDCWSVFGWYNEWLERLKHELRETKALFGAMTTLEEYRRERDRADTAEANKQAALDALDNANEQLVQMTAYAGRLELVVAAARVVEHAPNNLLAQRHLREALAAYDEATQKVQR